MAYDQALADRIKAQLAATPQVSERKMFGGLAFLIGGHMAIVASSRGDLMARVPPAEFEELIATTGARPAEMGGRIKRGWLRVDVAELATQAELAGWVHRSVRHVATLPPKG